MRADNDETFEHFCVHGWMRVRAFSADEAAAMRAAAWRALADVGIRPVDPSTWTRERPEPHGAAFSAERRSGSSVDVDG